MLSLIENGKANPSMESLNYIAQRLGVETTELLEEVSITEIRELLDHAEKLYSSIQTTGKIDDFTQITEFIKPVADKITLSYESAKLLALYCRSLFYQKQESWKNYYDKAVSMFEALNLENERSKITSLYAMTKFMGHQYDEALEIIQNERERIAEQNVILDPITRLDLDYYESILCFAVGQTKRAVSVMNEAISFSKEKRIFYLTDDLYRLAAFQALMSKNEEQWRFYLKKLKQYADFADDQLSKAIISLLEAHYYNSYVHDYEKASEILDNYFGSSQIEEQQIHFFYPEKGKALFGHGKIEEALTVFEGYKIPEWVHHPYDLSMLYETFAYMALCYKKLGKDEQAMVSAKRAVELIEPLTYTPYKDFIYQTYKDIMEN